MVDKQEYYTDVQCIGDYIYYRGVKGTRTIKERIPFKPTLYTPSKEPSEWKTIGGENLSPLTVGGIKETRDFIKTYSNVDNFPLYGNSRFEYAFIAENFKENIVWDFEDIEIMTIDIEVDSRNGFPEESKAEQEIESIALHSSSAGYIVWGLKAYDASKSEIKNLVYFQCDNELQMLNFFVAKWQQLNPNVVTGWNVKYFDIPYLVNRLKRLIGPGGADKLSFWGKIKEREQFFMGRPRQCFDLVGTPILDYLQVYDIFMTGNRESTKLDYILGLELKTSKLDWSKHYKSLSDLYDNNHQMFIDYNIQDVKGVLELEGKLKLLETALTMAYDSKTNYDDVFAQVTMWDQLIHVYLLGKKIAIPQKKDYHKTYKYEGAYVKEPPPGMYKYVLNADLDSLYPHLIMQYNISPDCIVEGHEYDDWMNSIIRNGINVNKMLSGDMNITKELQKRGLTLTPNGQFFRTNKQGFLAEMLEKMYEDRKKYKKKMIDASKELELVAAEIARRKSNKETHATKGL